LRGAKPEKALERQLEAARIAPDGARLVVACSGGPDSVALASLIARLAGPHRWQPVLVHVNHGLRPSAWQDECVVVSVAGRLGLRVVVRAVEPSARDEESLRKVRYATLVDAARELGAGHVLTAHTARDQSETVLLALFRGTGLAGLAGIPERRRLADGIELVRPLLRMSFEALRLEVGASGLPYARDPSNDDSRYRRNVVRRALEGLRTEFPRLDEAVARCATIVAGELAAPASSATRRKVRERLAAEVGLRDIPFERIEAALAARTGRRVHIKRGVEVITGEHGADTRISRRED